MLRPALPNWPTCVWTFSRWNASGLIQATTVCGPAFGSPTTLGRLAGNPEMSGLLACTATWAEYDSVEGEQEHIDAMALSCEASSRVRIAAGALGTTCACHDTWATNRWRASKSDGPYSASRSNGFCARSFSPASGLAAAPPRFMDDR